MTNSADVGSSNPHGITNPNRATIGEILSQTFALARENFWFGVLVFGGASVITVVMLLISGVGFGFANFADPQAAQAALVNANPVMVIVTFFAVILVYLLAYLAIFARIALKFRGDGADLGSSLSLCVRRIGRLFGVSLLLTIAFMLFGGLLSMVLTSLVAAVAGNGASGGAIAIVVIASIALYIPLLWLGIRLIPVAGVAMTEDDAGVIGSITRGFKLSGGKWWSILLAGLLLGILVFIISLVGMLVGLIPIIGTIVFLAVMVFVNLLYSGFYMGTYFELVAAKEGRVGGDIGAVFE